MQLPMLRSRKSTTQCDRQRSGAQKTKQKADFHKTTYSALNTYRNACSLFRIELKIGSSLASLYCLKAVGVKPVARLKFLTNAETLP